MNSHLMQLKCDIRAVMFFTALFHIICLCPSSLARKVPPQSASTAQSRAETLDRYDPRRDPGKDLDMVSAEAKRSKKNILIVVGGEWCSMCHAMDEFFREHPDIVALRDKNYVRMKVSMTQENPNRRFLSRFPYIHGYPHIFVLDANKKLIKSQPTNELEEGNSYSVARFKEFLNEFAPSSR